MGLMALSIGIVGLANVGKSTLFNALTDNDALVANYPFATIEPNTGVVPVPDERLAKLAEIYKTNKIVPATITFVDIAGLIAGASQGEGLGNQFLANIRGTNAILHVVRAFEDDDITRSGSSTPQKDIEVINTELAIADLQTVGNRLPRLQKEIKADPKLKPALVAVEKAQRILDSGQALFGADFSDEEQEYLADLQLITMKPVIYVFNVDEKSLGSDHQKEKLAKFVSPAEAVFICAKLEDELRGLDENDRAEMLQSYGQEESGLNQLIKAAYRTLGLQSFLTAGEKEVRAWTIKEGSSAPQAAGAIHTDFEKGFIAAQVVSYEDLVSTGSLMAAKAAGKVRTEGKDYTMQPSDVVEFRFNV
jgi:GTP-binding protein YchF